MSPEMSHLLGLIGQEGEVDIVSAIEACPDINERLPEGESALYHAVLAGRIARVAAMLARGADPNFQAEGPAEDALAPTPLDLAGQARFLMDWDKYHPIALLLEAHGAKDSDGRISTPEQLKDIEARAKSRGKPRPPFLAWCKRIATRCVPHLERFFGLFGWRSPWALPVHWMALKREDQGSGRDNKDDLPRPPC